MHAPSLSSPVRDLPRNGNKSGKTPEKWRGQLKSVPTRQDCTTKLRDNTEPSHALGAYVYPTYCYYHHCSIVYCTVYYYYHYYYSTATTTIVLQGSGLPPEHTIIRTTKDRKRL